MQAALQMRAWVQPGGKIQIEDAHLPSGEAVDVIVLFPQPNAETRRPIVDILAEAPGHLAFANAEEVDAYMREK